MGCMIDGGAISQPIRQPVAANASSHSKSVGIVQRMGMAFLLPAEPTVTVRSHIPGKLAIRMCSFPSNTRQSY